MCQGVDRQRTTDCFLWRQKMMMNVIVSGKVDKNKHGVQCDEADASIAAPWGRVI